MESHRVAHGSGSDPAHCGYLEQFSNQPGSEATSNGAYMTADTYHGKYGLSMKVRGLDWSNSNAESRAIVIHNAWYAEPEMIAAHGKLGRSQGCFAFSHADQWKVMSRLGGGRMIYADKLGSFLRRLRQRQIPQNCASTSPLPCSPAWCPTRSSSAAMTLASRL